MNTARQNPTTIPPRAVQKKEATMPTCFDVADWFLAHQDSTAGDTISNLKLQKLCYYAQGFSLALLGKPMFGNRIEAWQHGPVIPELYREYRTYDAASIPVPKKPLDDIDAQFTKKQLEVLKDVSEVYGQFSAWKLRDLTHQEPPWLKHYDVEDYIHNETIPIADMVDYFKTQVESDACQATA